MAATKEELKQLLLNIVKDDSLSIDEIDDETQLIGEDGLFFDSIDVLELIVELEKKYGIKIKDNDIIAKKFAKFSSFFEFVIENAKK